MKKIFISGLCTLIPLVISIILGIIYFINQNQKILSAIGFFIGIASVMMFATLLSFIIKKKLPMKAQFDERQLKKRGDCFSISFFILIGGLFLDGMVRYILEFDWSIYLVGVACWIMLAIGVFAILAIWKDAYTNMGESKLRFGLFLLVVSLLDITLGIVNGIRMGFLEHGKLGICFINLFSGIILAFIAVNLFIKTYKERKDDFVDEELETEVC